MVIFTRQIFNTAQAKPNETVCAGCRQSFSEGDCQVGTGKNWVHDTRSCVEAASEINHLFLDYKPGFAFVENLCQLTEKKTVKNLTGERKQ